MALSTLKVSRRGSGSPQYPLPRMSAVVIYCYSQGVMSSRKNVHYDRAGNLEQQLRADIEELLQQGEKIDREETVAVVEGYDTDIFTKLNGKWVKIFEHISVPKR